MGRKTYVGIANFHPLHHLSRPSYPFQACIWWQPIPYNQVISKIQYVSNSINSMVKVFHNNVMWDLM